MHRYPRGTVRPQGLKVFHFPGRRIIGMLAAVGVFGMFGVGVASATQPAPNHKVTICHRTDSQTNPYVQITVDMASVDGNVGNDHGKGDHLAEHQGTVWFPGHAKEPKWGDIIPPFFSDGSPDGLPSLNWPSGQAIFENGCKPVSPPPPIVPNPVKATVTPHQVDCKSDTPSATVKTTGTASIGYAASKSATPTWVKREVAAGTYNVTLPALKLGASASWFIVVSAMDDSTQPVFYGPYSFNRPTLAECTTSTPPPVVTPPAHVPPVVTPPAHVAPVVTPPAHVAPVVTPPAHVAPVHGPKVVTDYVPDNSTLVGMLGLGGVVALLGSLGFYLRRRKLSQG